MHRAYLFKLLRFEIRSERCVITAPTLLFTFFRRGREPASFLNIRVQIPPWKSNGTLQKLLA